MKDYLKVKSLTCIVQVLHVSETVRDSDIVTQLTTNRK